MTADKNLPFQPHLEHLRKEAKRRLAAMQERATGARLAEAQNAVARDYGFSEWSALKAAVERKRTTPAARPWVWQPQPDDGTDAFDRFLPGAATFPTGIVLLMGAMFVVLATLLSSAHAQTGALDKYAGAYRLDARHVFVVTDIDGHLFAQLGQQPQLEIFPEDGAKFAPKAIPGVEIAFTTDDSGAVTAVTIHQNGHDITMPRIAKAEADAIAALPSGHPMPVTWPQKAIAPRLLTPAGKSFDVWPCFSPDGKTIVFSRSDDRGRTWKFFKVAATGGEAAQLADLPVSPTRCNWSAQDKIAFTGLAGNTGALWVMNSDGSGAHAVATPGVAQPAYPSWYPDGKSLVVMDGEKLTVQHINLADGSATALTDRAQVLTGMPSVSPDGKWVAFAGQPNKGQRYDQEENAIWLVGDGKAHPLEALSLQGRAPVWSPDGKKIAFESDRGNDKGHYAIFVINRDGTGPVQLTDFALDATHPVFSRDGHHMVFSHGGAISGIAVIDLP